MPIANMRTVVGVASDKVNTFLSAAVAAGATTLNVTSATGITTSSTVFIVDGANSESRAVTAVTGNQLTVAALTYAHSANAYVFAQPTATIGPSDYLPVTGQPKFQDVVTKLLDKGYRGSNIEAYASVDGVAHGELEFAGDFYPDTFGYLPACMLGAEDYTAGSPNSHVFAANNAGNGQPTAYVFYFYDVTNTRAYAGARLDELMIKLDPAGLITYTAKAKSMQGDVVANPAPVFSTVLPVAAWRAGATLAGAALGTLITAEISFKRVVTPVHTQSGWQGPYRVFAGALAITGKANFIKEDDSVINNFYTNAQPSLSFSFTQGSGAPQTGLTIQMTKCNFETGYPLLGSNEMFEDEITFSGLGNVTDANVSGGGQSPGRVTLLNAKGNVYV